MKQKNQDDTYQLSRRDEKAKYECTMNNLPAVLKIFHASFDLAESSRICFVTSFINTIAAECSAF